MPYAENISSIHNRPPELDMAYDQLVAQPGMRSEQLQPNVPVEVDLNSVEPVAQSGAHRLVAVTKVEGPDGPKELNVWATRTESGTVVSLAAADADPTQEGKNFRGYVVATPGKVGFLRQPQPGNDAEARNVKRLGAVPHATLQNSMVGFGLSADGKTLGIIDRSTSGNRTSFLRREAPAVPNVPVSRGETTASRRSLEQTGPRPDSVRMAGTSAVSRSVERPEAPSHRESDSAQRTRRHIYEGVSKDPDFQRVAQPYRAQLGQYKATYEAERTRLEAQKSYASPEQATQINNSLARLRSAYEKAVQPVRDQFEQAIKPVLAERLRISRIDEGASYVDAVGKVVAGPNGRGQLINSESGKPITNEPPKLGAVTLPDRFSSWAGSDKEKRNEVTGAKTTSSEHIVNIAAAKVAGKWDAAKASKDPIVVTRDHYAELGLPRDFDHLKLWKVKIGQHRVAATRLLEGIDATIPYDQLDDTPNPYKQGKSRR